MNSVFHYYHQEQKKKKKREIFLHYKILGKMKYHSCWTAECTHRFGIRSGDTVCVKMMMPHLWVSIKGKSAASVEVFCKTP